MISIIIPYSSNEFHRQKAFEWNIQRWQHWYPEAELIVANYVSKSETGFNRAKVRNVGAEAASGDVLVFADADTFCHKGALDRMCDLVSAGLEPWGLPYDTYFNASQECTEYLLKQDPLYQPVEDEITYDHRLTDSISGVYVVRKSDWIPMDERFNGWGYEDRAHQILLDTMLGNHARIKHSFVIHCWHPAPESECFGQPMIVHNRKLNARYEEAKGNKHNMQAILDEPERLNHL